MAEQGDTFFNPASMGSTEAPPASPPPPATEAPASPTPASRVVNIEDEATPPAFIIGREMPEDQGVATAPTTLPRSGSMTGADGRSAQFLTEEEYLATLHPDGEENAGPAMILAVASALLVLAYAYNGIALGLGGMGAIGTAIGGVMILGFSIAVSLPVALLVARIFGEDLGSFGQVLLRVCAFCAAFDLVMVGVSAVIGPLFSVLVGLPVVVVMSMWLIGMQAYQAFVFAIAMTAIKFMITMLLIGAIIGAVMGAGAM